MFRELHAARKMVGILKTGEFQHWRVTAVDTSVVEQCGSVLYVCHHSSLFQLYAISSPAIVVVFVVVVIVGDGGFYQKSDVW